ncbi:ArsR/SmtB family transcription factor [Streptomyces ovatisporus]|uniref:ArsR/SmtB family transcription factor n=1 Tax=Streptomyces ovatisporus TaxID=1128682 RepID=A0ABV9A3C8_9ACTN
MRAPAALADPVRQEILVLLHARPRTVSEITEHFTVSRPAVSRHLRVLREAGLVVAEERGRERVYSIDPTPLIELSRWLDQFANRWEQRFDALETEVHRTRRERTRRMSPLDESKEKPA